MASTLMRGLVARGHDVVPLDGRPNPTAEALAGRPCAVLPPRLPWAKTALWHWDLLRRIPALGVPHDVLLNPTGYPTVRGSHPALAFYVHDLHMLQRDAARPWKRRWFALGLGAALRRARVVMCPSAATSAQVRERWALADDRCVVVPNAIDRVFPDRVPEGPRDAAPYFLFVGTLEPRKNLHRLLEAFARCRQAGITERLILAGRPGAAAEALRRRMTAPDLAQAVELRTGVDDHELAALYAGATALLFPSLDEGFGLPVVEAMQLGLPVLTSDVGALREVAGDAALLVDPRDLGALASGIAKLANDRALRQAMITRGSERALAFTPARQAEACEQALERLLDQPRGRRSSQPAHATGSRPGSLPVRSTSACR